MAREKPTVAFILSLIGGIIILSVALLALAASFLISEEELKRFLPVEIDIENLRSIVQIAGLVGIVSGILVIVGAIMINSGKLRRVKIGGIIVIIFSIASIFAGGGFFIGLILGLIGGILALIWKPKETVEKPAEYVPLPP
jgi:MFS family permease